MCFWCVCVKSFSKKKKNKSFFLKKEKFFIKIKLIDLITSITLPLRTSYYIQNKTNKKDFWVVKKLKKSIKNTPRVFHVETTSKRSFPCRFNMKYMWCVCSAISTISFIVFWDFSMCFLFTTSEMLCNYYL